MQRLRQISIENFRSVGEEPIRLTFPEKCPTIIIGENNAGKSNIIRAIELILRLNNISTWHSSSDKRRIYDLV